MKLIELELLKGYLRILGEDLDTQVTLAAVAAEAEASVFVGFNLATRFIPEDVPSDISMALFVLTKAHIEDDKADHFRGIAQRLLLPYREESGVRGA